jgi:CBS domain-containing protein
MPGHPSNPLGRIIRRGNTGRAAESLALVERTVADYLQRADIAAASDYLAGMARMIAPLRQQAVTARDMIQELLVVAASAEDAAGLRAVNERVVAIAQELYLSLHSAPMVHEACSTVREAIARRALELARRDLQFSGATCDLPLALLSVGSDGRLEQALFADQDYLFLHGALVNQGTGDARAVDDYFGMLGAAFAAILEKAGIKRCTGGIMPDNPEWRGSEEDWRRRLVAPARFETDGWARDVLNFIILSDVRFVDGDRNLGIGFAASVSSLARDNSQTIRNMARVASAMRVAIGFLRRFVVAAEEPHKGEFNLKLNAWMPLIMCIRLLAINSGIEETATLARIERLRRIGQFSDKLAAGLSDAYHVITGRRILQQIKKLKGIIDDDCFLNPYELQQGEREELRRAMVTVDDLQKLIRSNFIVA